MRACICSFRIPSHGFRFRFLATAKPRVPHWAHLLALACLCLAALPSPACAFDPADYTHQLQQPLDVWPYYVGNDEADLAVRVDATIKVGDPLCPADNIVTLYRDGTAIETQNLTFSALGERQYFVANDAGLAKGDTHQYKVEQRIECVDSEGHPDPYVLSGTPVSATVGEVGGIVTGAKTWSGGTWHVAYTYDGSILVEPGATLAIEPFTTVIASEGFYSHIWRVMGALSADRVSFVVEDESLAFQIRAQDEEDGERDYTNSSCSMTDCVVRGDFVVYARNTPVFEDNSVSGELYLYYRQLTSDPVALADIDNPKARLVIEDPADLTVKDNTLNTLEVRGTQPLDGGDIVVSENHFFSKSIQYGDESRLTVKNIGTSSLLVENNVFAEPYPGPMVFSHFTNSDASERRISGNQGMREIMLGDDADENGGVHHATVENNFVTDSIYNEGVCIRLDRGTHNSIRENSVVHPEWVSKGYPGAGIGLGWDTEIDREAVSCNLVEKNVVTGFNMGILLDWSVLNEIRENELKGGKYGMWLNSCRQNTITGNIFQANTTNMMLGPYLSSGDRPEANIIYDNLFGTVEGFVNVGFEGSSYKPNTWNTDKSAGPNVVGGPYLGGNFWADYEGSDENGDGLGDTPYAIVYDNADQLPLVMQTVNSTGDAPDADPDDGMCHTGSTIDRDGTSEPECTLRAAIEQANAREGWNRIFFDIPGDGIPVISPQRALPTVSETIILDGGSQPGAGKVKIDGSQAGLVNGLNVRGREHTFLVGLIIENFIRHGIYFDPPSHSFLHLNDLEIRGNGGYGVLQRSDEGHYPVFLSNCAIQGNQWGGLYLWTGTMKGEYLSIFENGGDGIYNVGRGFFGGLVVSNSTITNNLGYGIWDSSPSSGVSVGGTAESPMRITGNGKGGIRTTGRVTASFVDIRGNGGEGIYAAGRDGIILWDSSVRANQGDGVLAEEGIASAKRSSVSGNNGHGIHAMGSGNRNWAAEMQDMTLAGNQGHGLYSEDGYVMMGDCRFYGNVQSGVRVEGGNVLAREIMSSQNWGDGLDLDGDADIQGGEACRNQGQDVVVDGTATISSFACAATCQSTDFNASATSGDVPLNVDFSEAPTRENGTATEAQGRQRSGEAEVFSWHWDFGDGDTSILPAPAHVYKEAGTYDVVLSQVMADGTWRSSVKTGLVEAVSACTENANCDDGIYCNGAETCEQGTCKDGAPPCSEDGLFCNGVVWCDEDSETCKTTPVPCDASGLSCDEANDACLCDSSLQGVAAILQIMTGLVPEDPRLSIADVSGDGVVSLDEAGRFMREAAPATFEK